MCIYPYMQHTFAQQWVTVATRTFVAHAASVVSHKTVPLSRIVNIYEASDNIINRERKKNGKSMCALHAPNGTRMIQFRCVRPRAKCTLRQRTDCGRPEMPCELHTSDLARMCTVCSSPGVCKITHFDCKLKPVI